jgi:transcriptional regulator with XRE-family HTH domain
MRSVNFFLWQNTHYSEKSCIFATSNLGKFNTGNNMEDRLLIANNMKRMREASGYTQENVADFLGVRRSAYANYEAGVREIPLTLMEKLADLYGCDLYDLYTEDESALAGMLVTAFRVESLSASDMEQIATFKRIVKNSLKMDNLLAR